ncbi:MAG: tetratricopeptide repeat protein [Candidatus Lokiarchaeota archaeon]|nr:tetratricopeptide repeat protein [Candidatus Lokiarchaeota archaeon]
METDGEKVRGMEAETGDCLMIEPKLYKKAGFPLLFDVYEKELRDQPGLLAHLRMVRDHIMQGQLSIAESLCLDLVPDYDLPAVWYILFIVYWFQKNIEAIERTLNRAARTDVHDIFFNLMKADAFAWSEDPHLSLSMYTGILCTRYETPYVFWMAGLVQTTIGWFYNAVDIIRTCLDMNPGASVMWERYALALTKTGRIDQARQELTRVAQDNPHEWIIWRALGQVLLLQEEWAEGLKVFRRLNEMIPDDAFVSVGLGSCLKGTGHKEASLKHFRKATRRKGHDFDAWMNLGVTLSELEREEEAIAALEKARAINPEKFDASVSDITYMIEHAIRDTVGSEA